MDVWYSGLRRFAGGWNEDGRWAALTDSRRMRQAAQL